MARTFTSAVRLLDTLSVFRGDFRVEVTFAFDDSSAFREGVEDLLRAAGARLVSFPEAARGRFDLALTASENIELERIDAPILVLPHGIGFHRHVPDSAGPGERLSGVVPAGRLPGKDAWMAITHPGQQEQLLADYPDAAARCVLVGDLTYDRMVASVPLRDHYRRSLGVRDSCRLVVITSTWGAGSLIQAWKELPARLLGELPADEYRVALVLHPNVWFWHSEYQVQLWLADARDAGLLLVPPSGGWQAGLVAADAIIGDHGSVTMYGAALDRPVLLAGDRATARVVPGTPPAHLARTAPRLDGSLPLRPQVAEAIGGHRPGQYAGLAGRMFARRGEAAQLLRDLLYDRLGLAAPQAVPAVRAVGVARPEGREPCSFAVFSRMGEPDEVRMWRFPAAVGNAGAPDPPAFRHLCAGEEEPDLRLPANASVIVRRAATGHQEADAWITATFGQYPGSRVVAAAVTGGCIAGLRDGQRIHVSMPGADPALAASAVYTCLRAGRLGNGQVTVRTGGSSVPAVFGPYRPA